jgi:ABC-type nitrate/sulfonate/bicarbonate transport system substrate-binding protein
MMENARMRIVVPDLVSNSYFPALAAEDLGYYAAAGLEAHVDILSPAPRAMAALRDGTVDAVAGAAHTVLSAFSQWQGARLVVALSQGVPWLLVLRADVPAQRGEWQAVRGLRIGAAPGPDTVLRYVLTLAGVEPERDGVQIVRVPGADAPGASFGILAAQALETRQIDGFWANALGSETAVRRGVGKIVVDVRRGDGPASAHQVTCSVLITTDALIARAPEQVAAAVRAIVSVQQALRTAPQRATEVGRRRFPPEAAALIASVVARDVPFYDPAISPGTLAVLDRFARASGWLTRSVPYEQIVATQFQPLWQI